MTEDAKLVEKIMGYWNDCIYGENASADKDFKVNDLIYNYALSVGINQELIDNRVDLTVRNMTNSQKRKLIKMLLESGIRENG